MEKDFLDEKKASEKTRLSAHEIHGGHRARMKERYNKNGIESFCEHEMLEMMLYNVFSYSDTNPLAHALLNRFGSLFNVIAKDSRREFLEVEGAGEATYRFFSAMREVLLYSEYSYLFSDAPLPKIEKSTDAADIKKYYKENFDLAGTKIILLYMSPDKKIISNKIFDNCTLTSPSLDLSLILRTALEANAGKISILSVRDGLGIPNSAEIGVTFSLKKMIDNLSFSLDGIFLCVNGKIMEVG